MEVQFTFEVQDAHTGTTVKAAHEVRLIQAAPMTSLYAVEENGLLVVLLPNGTYRCPNGPPLRVVWHGVQK